MNLALTPRHRPQFRRNWTRQGGLTDGKHSPTFRRDALRSGRRSQWSNAMLNRFPTLAALFGLFLLSGVSAQAADNDTAGGEGPAKSGGSSQRTSIVIITIERGTSNTFPE